MRASFVCAAVLLLPTGPLPAQTAVTLSPAVKAFVSVDAPVVALTHVLLIDGTGAPPAQDQTIVMEGGKIAAVGKTGSVKIPPSAQGPYLTGEGSGGGMHQILDAESARRVVDYWADEGATWLKFYTTISRAAMAAAIDEAHKRGLRATGHLCSVSFREAVALGIDNLEHGLLVNTDYDPDKQPDLCPPGAMTKLADLDVSSDAVRATFHDMVAHHVAMTSTLAVFELFVPNRPPLDPRVLDALAPEVKSEYLGSREKLSQAGAFSVSPELLKKAMQYEYEFVKAGGLLAAGVDPTGNGGALPGFGDQRNFELLVEAGFTPVQAIAILTGNGAKVLGQFDRFGSVTAGKSADLVVINGDPIARPADIRKVTIVFKDGVGYDSPKLIESIKGTVGLR